MHKEEVCQGEEDKNDKDDHVSEATAYQHGAMSTVQGTTCHQAIDRVQTVQWYISRIGGM